MNMVTTLNPTLFIVALSARLTTERVTEAGARVELAFQRDCIFSIALRSRAYLANTVR